jgi:hypothetical protein
MVDFVSHPESDAANQAAVQDGLVSLVEDLSRRFIARAIADSIAQGWSLPHAEAAGALGTALFLELLFKGAEPEVAVSRGIGEGRKLALGEMFKTELKHGRDRHTAFLNILGLHEDFARRLGREPQNVPDDWIAMALAVVDEMAAIDEPPEDQVNAGLMAIAREALQQAMDAAEREPIRN